MMNSPFRQIQEIQRPTLQCVHCGVHWVYQPGEGKIKRGICLKCMGPTCGNKKCDGCNPYHK